MGALSGTGMDPVPYFFMAYGLGAVGLFGFAGWTLQQRIKLRAMLAAVRPPGK